MSRHSTYLDDATFARARDLIYDLTGIRFSDSRRYLLENRIRKRAQANGLERADQYLDLLSGSADTGGEVAALIEEVTTNETSFFRHQRQIEIFRELLEELVAARRRAGDLRLRMWSAACSSGEEVYTLAMVVADVLGDENGWNVKIRGTDINSAEITRARRGVYTRRQLSGVTEPFLSRYTVPVPGDAESRSLSPKIRAMTEFDVGSLLDPNVAPPAGSMDMVFCRNVLIYFDQDSKRRVFDTLEKALAPGGYLILGPSESLFGLTNAFLRTPHSAYNFFRKPPATDGSSESASPSPVGGTDADRAGKSSRSMGTAAAQTSPPPRRHTLKEKMLVRRLDAGLKDLERDLERSLARVVESLGKISDSLDRARETDSSPGAPSLNSGLAAAQRELNRALIYLQVADRAQQKVEALRATLQELSDRVLADVPDAPDLQVRTTTFDTHILAAAGTGAEDGEAAENSEDQETDGEALSQDDIDALFQ